MEQSFKTEEVTTEDINYYLKMLDEYKKVMRLRKNKNKEKIIKLILGLIFSLFIEVLINLASLF